MNSATWASHVTIVTLSLPLIPGGTGKGDPLCTHTLLGFCKTEGTSNSEAMLVTKITLTPKLDHLLIYLISCYTCTGLGKSEWLEVTISDTH